MPPNSNEKSFPPDDTIQSISVINLPNEIEKDRTLSFEDAINEIGDY